MINRVFLLFILMCSLLGCSESNFKLAHDSRIPKWFDIPEGMSRSDLDVRLNYYIRDGQREAEFLLLTKSNKKIKSVIGLQKGLEPIKSNDSKNGRPVFEIITVDGITEVIEHRAKNNYFHIYDGAFNEVRE